MTYPLVTQLGFTRCEFVRCFKGVTPEEAVRRIGSMNCLSWIVGHLASQEQYLWLESTQRTCPVPGLHDLVGFRSPPTKPPWDEMWENWQIITDAANKFLETLTADNIASGFARKDDYLKEDIGTSLLRNIYHYWFHIGEAHAIRQMLGHEDLPQFVGNMSTVVHKLD